MSQRGGGDCRCQQRGYRGRGGHLSTEVTPQGNTGFLNNRALGMRVAGERRDFGDQEQPQLKSLGVDWSFLAFTRRKLLEKFLEIETLIPMLSHNLLSELQMQIMHKPDILKVGCQMRRISPLWGCVCVSYGSFSSFNRGRHIRRVPFYLHALI